MMDINKLLKTMTLKEKIGQLNLVSYKEEILKTVERGEVGAVLNVRDHMVAERLQKAALASPKKIPLLLAEDVIHGFKTIFPVPLGEACSFNPELMENSSRYAMLEAREAGINWIYAPMLDLTNDPRWGRIMETGGEDPFLNSIMAERKVRGTQTEDSGRITAACAKHYLGYGAVEAGLDYATSDFSETRMRNYYLPPFQAAVSAGVMSVMTAFTTYNDLPVTMSSHLIKNVLRNESGFGGLVVSDWQAIRHLVNFGVAEDEKEAGLLAFTAGIDMDMNAKIYGRHLEELVRENPALLDLIDESVLRVLEMKAKMGLFKNPFGIKNPSCFKEKIREAARKTAEEAIVLFKNEGILPLSKDSKILVTGPFVEDKNIHLGAWSAAGHPDDVVSIREGLSKNFPNAEFHATKLEFDASDLDAIREKAQGKDCVVLALGEPRHLSGENNCRTKLDLPHNQEALVSEVKKLGLPIVAIVSAGRPLLISGIHEKANVLLWNFHLGSEAGNALASVLAGDANPSAKTTVTFPKESGQIPIYYNRYPYGRPDIVHYADGDMEPLYPFGFGLSYSEFKYHDFACRLEGSKLMVELEVENMSDVDGKEVVQVYLLPDLIRKLVPRKKLIAYKKIFLKARSKQRLVFEIPLDLEDYRRGITIMVGPSSIHGRSKYISLN
ncbi:MAG: glycoside hydrolase family 3 N-terminal domain-containing protein [Bacilli bacterium]